MGRLAMIVALVLTAHSGAAEATLVEAMGIEEMASRSSFVVVGKVMSKVSGMKDGRISTAYEVSVNRGWTDAENPQSQVKVVLPGGQIDNLAQTASGVPEFRIGEEVLLFLWAPPTTEIKTYRLLGMSMGHFQIIREAEAWAISDRRGLVTVDKAKRTQSEGDLLRVRLKTLEIQIEKGMRPEFRRIEQSVRNP